MVNVLPGRMDVVDQDDPRYYDSKHVRDVANYILNWWAEEGVAKQICRNYLRLLDQIENPHQSDSTIEPKVNDLSPTT